MNDARFDDLPPEQRVAAQQWLERFVERRGGEVSHRLLSRLVGPAKRLAKYPPSPAWGRKMLSLRGSKARKAMSRAGRLSELMQDGRLEALLNDIRK